MNTKLFMSRKSDIDGLDEVLLIAENWSKTIRWEKMRFLTESSEIRELKNWLIAEW